MRERAWCGMLIGGLIVLAALIFGSGINWGLPSRRIDPFLFGTQTPLTGAQINQLMGNWDEDPTRPADVAAGPILDRSRPITLIDPTQTSKGDAVNRARILLRYRLYSDQPDEMITFRALAMMHPGRMQFDPKLYQYGGLWIYPVGAIIKIASALKFVKASNDRAFYLDSPGEFARFYILARGYSALWGIVAMLAVFGLVRRAAGGLLMPAIGAICFMMLPVVVEMAHEAKPHLGGAALLLLAVLGSSKYVETGKWKWIVWTAIACGAAAGMVLSGVIGLIVLPAMCLCRRDRRWLKICITGVLIAAGVYFALNPYVAIHLLVADQRAVLTGNLANTQAMYALGTGVGAGWNAIRLIAVGTAWPIAIIGLIGACAILIRRSQSDISERGSIGPVLAAVALVNLIQFTIFAANKPAEYARFAIMIDIALMLAAILAISRFIRPSAVRAGAGIGLIVLAGLYSAGYERAFLQNDSRVKTAQRLNDDLAKLSGHSAAAAVLYVDSEPAPYCLAPVNLFRWRIVLLGRDGRIPDESSAGVVVKPEDSLNVLKLGDAPISWADKPFEVKLVGGS
jgi:hypothetical protein